MVFSALRVPCIGDVTIANVKGSAGLSGSVPVSVIALAVLWVTATVWAVAVGVEGATTSVTVARELTLGPLLTVNVKLSVPLKPVVGV